MDTIFLTDGFDLITTSSEDFMRIGLMPHIPNKLIKRRLVDVMQGNSQLNYAQP